VSSFLVKFDIGTLYYHQTYTLYTLSSHVFVIGEIIL